MLQAKHVNIRNSLIDQYNVVFSNMRLLLFLWQHIHYTIYDNFFPLNLSKKKLGSIKIFLKKH